MYPTNNLQPDGEQGRIPPADVDEAEPNPSQSQARSSELASSEHRSNEYWDSIRAPPWLTPHPTLYDEPSVGKAGPDASQSQNRPVSNEVDHSALDYMPFSQPYIPVVPSDRAAQPPAFGGGHKAFQWDTPFARPNPVFIGTGTKAVNPDLEDADGDVWERYTKEAADSDKLSIGDWNQNMDVLMIFAGLFSAVLTAFIIEFYRLLQPQQDDISAQLLIDISLVLRASAQGLPIPEPLANFTELECDSIPLNYVVWVSSLWFASLICSLGVAIAVMTVKQWFQYYKTNANSGDFHHDALRRQYRYNALIRWKVPMIVSGIPSLMHLSVGLFFAGLVVLLWNINLDVAYLVLAVIIIVYTSYFCTMLLPLFSACPYKSSTLTLLQDIYQGTLVVFWSVIYRTCHVFGLPSKNTSGTHAWLALVWEKIETRLVGVMRAWLRSLNEGANSFLVSPLRFAKQHLDEAEKGVNKSGEELVIWKAQGKLDIDSILWLISASGRQNLVDLGLACVSQLKPEPKLIDDCLRYNIPTLLCVRSYIPLPNSDHSFWKGLQSVTVSDCLSVKEETRIPAIQSFLHSLMFLWHHPAYYDDDPPSAISNSSVWDHPSFFADSQWRLRLPKATEATEARQPPPRLLADWLVFWRALVAQSKADYRSITNRKWNLDFFADIVCVETHFFHLIRRDDVGGQLVREDMHDIRPWSDFYDLISH